PGRARPERLARGPGRLHAAPVRRRHERAPRPARRRRGGLGGHLAGRPGRHDPGRPAGEPDPASRDQRHRAAHPRGGAAADRGLPERGAAAPRRFADAAEAVAYFRETLAPYGALTDAQWAHLAGHSVREDEAAGGGYRLRHDPAIGRAYRPWLLGSLAVWEHWDKVACPTLLLRGELSDLLTLPTALEMTRRGPRPGLVEFPDVGHVPALMTAEQLGPVLEFLA
ncbi:MAG TPA: hypothetical protein VF590_20345, partial [Isosphaeraceae bacterium]